jgi:hypothetical protein
MNINIDYNYPFLQKTDTISQRNLDSSDYPPRKFKQINTNRDFSLNNYSLDIEGAFPKRYGFYNKKPDYTNTNLDIEGTTTNTIHKLLYNKPEFINNNSDMEFTKPRGHHVFQNNRHLNPLNPEYQLPSPNKENPIPIPKFIRNSIDISDINGAHPKLNKFYFDQKQDIMNKYSKETDVDYLSFKKNYKGNKDDYNYLDYRDVYKKRPFSNRKTDPLNPIYKITYDGIENVFAEIDRNKPNCYSKFHYEKDGKGNRTDDIEGNETDSVKNVDKFKKKFKRPLIYSASNVLGAQAGTLLKGIKTNRCLSPLDPEYQFLGEKEMEMKRKKMNDNSDNNSFENNSVNYNSDDDNENKNIKKLVNKSKSNVNVVRNFNYNFNKDERKNNYNNYNNNYNYNQYNKNYNNRYVQTENYIPKYEKIKNFEISIPNKSTNISRKNSNNNIIEPIKEETEEKTNNKINNNNINIENNKKSVNDIITEKLKNLPYYQDEVKFDKEKYKRPEIYNVIPRERNIIIPSVPTGQSLQNYYKQLKDSQKYYFPYQDQIRYQRLNDNQIKKELLNNSYENRLNMLIKKHSS